MKILITGATGFLGSHTAEELSQRGHSLIALVRSTSDRALLKKLNVEFLEGSLPECDSLSQALSKVDAVVHIAGIVKALSKTEFHHVNAQGTANLVREVLQAQVRPKIFLYVSSIAVHNPSESENFCLPSEVCHPVSDYGQSKLEGELALKPLWRKVRTIILRPPVLYGPRDQELLPLFQAIQRGLAPLFQQGKNQLSFCYGPEVARAIADLLENPPPENEIFCLDDGKVHTWLSAAQNIAQVLDKQPQYLSLPKWTFFCAAAASQVWAQLRQKPAILTLNKLQEMKQKSWVCGSKKIQEAINWRSQTDLHAGLEKTLVFYREQGLLTDALSPFVRGSRRG